ncbi:hypothetical protein AM24_121 [Acinetobacter phage AM24]|nr:hypothetical protein AM24_121 [Acinetobacter phage AM24]
MHIQKGQLRFNKRELWNLDKHLAKVIVQGLQQFKSVHKNTIPPHLVTEDINPETGREVYWDYSSEYCEQQWQELLDKMIFAFTEHPTYFDIEPYDFHYDDLTHPEKFPEQVWEEHPVYGKITEWRQVLKEGVTQEDVDAWWERSRAYDAEIKRKVDEGRELFIKHFDNLWD